MHRLFVAIRPPEPIRDRLLDLMEGVSGVRWQDEEQLHLTLRFIGEVDRHVAADVHAALGGIHHPRFEIALGGLGMFDRRGVPATLWVGVTPPDPLRTLHNKVDQALARAGVPPDTRAFHPHITLARLGRGTGDLRNFMSRVDRITSAPFAVASFQLYESRLTQSGAIHTELALYPLR